MTQSEMLIALTLDYLDSNDLVKPHQTDGDSDNGVYFSSIAQILSNSVYLEDDIQKCYLEPGLLARKPKGINSQQESFDDLLGRAIRCIQSGNTKEPREILLYGLRHCGIYNTDNKLEAKDELFRFVFVFMYMFAAAFPFLKGIVKSPLTWYCNSFSPTSISDTSGLQLQFLMSLGHDFLYKGKVEAQWYEKFKAATGKKLSDIFATYYSDTHPFTQFVKANLNE